MKKLLAFLLAAALMLGVLAPGLGTLSAFAVGTSKLPSVTSGDLTFVVPETIYLAPDARSWSIATSTPFQFYVNNSQSGATTANAAETTGKIYYSLSGGSGATLSYQFLDASLSAMSGGSVTLSSSSISSGGSVNITGGTSPSLAASANGCYLRWTLSFTEKSIAKKAYAYTYIYKPYVIPVAAAALAGTGTSSGANWAGTLTWLSGMHGISVDGMPDYSYADSLDSYEANNYLKFTEFACFTSSASTAYVGGTAVNVAAQGVATSSWAGHDTGKAGDRRYVVFANTSGTPKSYAYMLFENNREPTSYNNGSSDTNQNWGVRNTTFAKYRGNNKDIVTKAVAKSIGTITIDTSRYSNLNQIPNLAVGLAVTTDKACDDGTGRWWIADISQTSFSHRSTWYKTDEDGLESTAMERDYIFAGQGNNWHTRSYDTNEGIRYAGAWNRTLLNTGNIEQMYYVKSLYGNAEKSAGSNYDANACGYVGLKATYVNKTALRAAVNRAIAKMPALGVTGISGNGMTSCYFDASDANYKWTAFQSAFNEASKGLTRVDTDASTVLSLTNSLNSALDALQTYYTVNGNGGELSNYQNSYTTVGTDQYGIGIVSVRAQRTGYLLQGWNVNPNATAAQAEPANHVTVGYNNTVYAIWAPAVYDINYTLNEGSFTGTYPTNYTIEDDDITLATPVRTGYRFTGWSGTGLTGENNMTVTIPAGSTGERNYTAHWVLDQFTITFDTDGGTPIAPITADYGATITAPPNPTKEGHYFLYWTKNGDVTYLPSTMPAESYTVKANWLINRYVITFDTDGGSEIDPISGVYGTAVTPPADPTKEGYLFASWDPAIPETIPGANLTVTAQWVTPTITFDTDGGSAIAPISQVAGTAVTPPANPTKEGFIFNGWSPALPETMPAENLTVTAQWINPTITFDTNGGSAVAPISQAAGTAITPPADPTKDGFVFSGWDPALPETMPGENLTVTAIWNQLYTATFDLNGGNINGSTIVSPVVLCAGDPLAAPIDPEKDDCVFTGWSPAVPTSMPAENVTYTAQWEPALHTVTFDLNGGNVNGSTANVTDQLHTGDPVTAPDPVRDGYRFLGWEPAVPDVMPASDASFTAVWAALYTATFDLNGGNINGSTIVSPVVLCAGDPLAAPVDPEKDDCVFTGWSPAVPTSMPAENVIYTAQWEPALHTVTFDLNGGNVNGSTANVTDQLHTGDPVTAPDPVRDGYRFLGWEPAVPDVMPASDASFTAVWAALYTATFDLNGGNINGSTIVSPVVLCAGDPLAAPIDPEKDDCVFTGWSPAVPTSMPAENVTYTAQWEPALHTVTFDLNGGNVNGNTANVTDQLHTGDPVTAPDPVRDGYRFLGWEPAVPDVMPASDASFTAVWAKLYTATFCLEGGSINGSTADVVYTLCEGDPLIAPVDPVLAYYAFTGWDPQVSDEMPDSDVTYYATWELLPIEVLRHSLSLNGDIGVNFYVRIPNATRNAYAEFTVAGKTVNVPINLNQYVVLDGERLYRFTCDVHSAQTSLPISGIVYNGDDQSEPFTYSVHTYLDEAMANPITQNNTKFMALASSIATYAYYANELLGYDKNFKQQELFDDSGMAAVTAESLIDSAAQISDTPAGVLYYGSSLILQTTTAIRHYFSLPANTTIDDFTFTLGSGSTAVTLTPIPSGSYYYVEIPNIASGNLGVPYTVTVTDEDGNAVNTWIYSALSYAYRALTSDTVTTQTVNAAKALVLYSQAADAYFHP